jgi:hypothetical protein
VEGDEVERDQGQGLVWEHRRIEVGLEEDSLRCYKARVGRIEVVEADHKEQECCIEEEATQSSNHDTS